jgi:hypothetical protein
MRTTTKLVLSKNLKSNLRAMRAALNRETLVPMMEDNLQPMAADMRAHAHRASGRMADSVTVGTKLSPAQAASNVPIAEIEVYAGPGPSPEAIQEEFGNFRQSPRPFIRPAFDGHVKSAMRGISEDGIDVILGAVKKG